ncbi:MAG: tRNA (cytidine(34)-2'-O)-methyltransferase [Hyphomicrobiaceae bacterium]|nr:tRNA (cytidine(34)-2'-O)-methyltransferase [Hyphomicrobiaceae bacterium]
MRIALYQPDIPQNTGTIMRLAACFGLSVDIIGPAGFDLSDRALKRAGLDYLERTTLHLHEDFEHFLHNRVKKDGMRLVLSTTRGQISYLDHRFTTNDIVLMGRESAGVPEPVHAAANATLKIPMRAGNRSLNLAVSTAMIVGEALRQTNGFQFEEQNNK